MIRPQRLVKTTFNSEGGNRKFNIGIDLNQDNIFLSGRVLQSTSFAQLMLVISRIVKIDNLAKRDHTRYQTWVKKRYYEILMNKYGKEVKKQANLLEKKEELIKEIDLRKSKFKNLKLNLKKRPQVFNETVIKFWNWLWYHDRDVWMLLDPIVSVQPEETFFEAFSKDESIYAVVKLPHTSLEIYKDFSMGTTNIDFSSALEREFGRTRSYRPLDLSIGADAVGLATDHSSVIEKKIDLPDSWIAGLTEVQAASTFAAIEFDISGELLARILWRLQREKEKTGPRSLRFILEPGQPIAVLIEPWNETFRDHFFTFNGVDRHEIRVWGRRRLLVLRNLIHKSKKIGVRLLDSGMPSFWNIEMDGISLEIGLSGWSSMDWAGKARFSSYISSTLASKELVFKVFDVLKEQRSLSSDEVSQSFNISTTEAKGALQAITLGGKALYDSSTNTYKLRELVSELKLDSGLDSPEQKFGINLFKKKKITITKEFIEDDNFYYFGLEVDSRVTPQIGRNVDGQIVYSQCTCSFFKHNKLRQGPCRHIIALSLQVG